MRLAQELVQVLAMQGWPEWVWVSARLAERSKHPRMVQCLLHHTGSLNATCPGHQDKEGQASSLQTDQHKHDFALGLRLVLELAM